MLAGHDPVERHVDDRLGEVRYGDWTGGELKKLAKDPLWKVVQSHPSAMTFPGEGGESMRDMQARAVDAVRDWNARLGDDAVYVVVSHGDVIKAVLADALGMHLDQFQRLVVDPSSVSVVTYTALRPFVVRANDMGSDLGFLVPRKGARRSRRRRAAPPTPSSAAARARRPPADRIGSSHGSHRLRVRPAGALRGGHGRRARSAHVLPAGPRRRPDDERRAGEAAGVGARRAGRRAARRGRTPVGRRGRRPRRHTGRGRRRRPAGRADRGGVPGRHDGARLGRRRRARRHRGPGADRGRRATATRTTRR